MENVQSEQTMEDLKLKTDQTEQTKDKKELEQTVEELELKTEQTEQTDLTIRKTILRKTTFIFRLYNQQI